MAKKVLLLFFLVWLVGGTVYRTQMPPSFETAKSEGEYTISYRDMTETQAEKRVKELKKTHDAGGDSFMKWLEDEENPLDEDGIYREYLVEFYADQDQQYKVSVGVLCEMRAADKKAFGETLASWSYPAAPKNSWKFSTATCEVTSATKLQLKGDGVYSIPASDQGGEAAQFQKSIDKIIQL